MKKSAGTAMAVMGILMLSACSQGNTNNNYSNYNGANQGSYSRKAMAVNYRDGVYTGFGDNHENGRELATVTVKGGIIVDITLVSLDSQGRPKYPDNGFGSGAGGTVVGSGSPVTGMGVNTNGTSYNYRGDLTGNEPTANNGIGNMGGYISGNIAKNNPAAGRAGGPRPWANGNNYGAVTPNPNDAAVNVAISRFNSLRNTLSISMLQSQTSNVAVEDTDPNMVPYIINWKLAVSRALSQASQ